MKHEITSYNTKKMLAESLKKAMSGKPFSKITVSEIINDCGVNRKTFYYHFSDIYALLKWMFDEEAVEVVKKFDLLVDYDEAIRFAMDYIEQNNYLINCAYHSIGRDAMKRFFYSDFVGVVSSVIDAAEADLPNKLEPEFKEYSAKFYAEAIAGMLIDWIVENDRSEKEKNIGYLISIIDAALESLKHRKG